MIKKMVTMMVMLMSVGFCQKIGDKCPDRSVLTIFEDKTYLLVEQNNKMIHCRPPNSIDSFLVVVGVYTRDSLINRVSGIRYVKYDNSYYSMNEVENIFYASLNDCDMRPDGLYECGDVNRMYYSVSNNKKGFHFVEYSPASRTNICEKIEYSYGKYNVNSLLYDMNKCYNFVQVYATIADILFKREYQLTQGEVMNNCETEYDTNCVSELSYRSIKIGEGISFGFGFENSCIFIYGAEKLKPKVINIHKSKRK